MCRDCLKKYEKEKNLVKKVICDRISLRKLWGGNKMLFVEYPKCTTCKKAKKWLDDNQLVHEDRHIVEDNPTAEEIKVWVEMSGLPIKRFFNTSGMKYRELELKDKLQAMTDEEQYALLATDGMLVKRPVLVGDDFVKVGFREKEWSQLL